MAQNFLPFNRQQAYLMPPDLQEWLPQNHLARFIADVVGQLDLTDIFKAYTGQGGSLAYHPEVLLSLLFYGYATGTFSSRKIERATYDSIAFRYLSANTHPDHDTIATFRRRFLSELNSLFVQILLIARESGFLKVGTVSLDGTKVTANASKHKAMSYAYAQKLEAQLEAEVQRLMEKAQMQDEQEVNDGMDIPDEIARRQDRLSVIKEAKAKIEQRAKERYEAQKKIYDEKIAKRTAKEKATGKKTPGRPPKPPTEEPTSLDQVNFTDEESRIMKTAKGGFEQCYNAQASADHDSRLILHHHLTQHTNDKQEVLPTLQWFTHHPELAPKSMAADTGYFSEANVCACEAHHITPYISMRKEAHNLSFEERFKPNEPLPDNPTPLERMKHRLHTPEGKALYALRKSTIEPIFGIIKQVMGFRQFLLRGLEKVEGEWGLVCLAYNLKRMHTLIG